MRKALDSKAAELILVAVLGWVLYDTALLATGGTLYFGGLGYFISLAVAALWVYGILSE